MPVKTDKKNYKVTKANNFVRETQNDLTLTQKRVMAYIFSLVKKDDKEFKHFELTVNEFLTLIGNTDSGNNYANIVNALKGIDKKSWWVSTNDQGTEIERIRYFDVLKVSTSKIQGTLSSSLKPYLLELTENFTEYQLVDYLKLTSDYSMILFEHLKSFQYLGHRTEKVDDLKRILGVPNGGIYDQFKFFNQKVLSKAVKEINEKTTLWISYTTNKAEKSRNVVSIAFTLGEQKLPKAYGDYENVFLSDDEYNTVVYEWMRKCDIDALSRYKYIEKINRRTGDFVTLKRWYKEALEKVDTVNTPDKKTASRREEVDQKEYNTQEYKEVNIEEIYERIRIEKEKDEHLKHNKDITKASTTD